MHIQLRWLSVALICGILQISSVQSQCETCMASNDASCVDEDSYYLCHGNNPSKTELHHCESGEVCTDTENICEPKDGPSAPVCGESCNKCPTSGPNLRYTCVSKDQFGRCVNGKVTSITSRCEAGYICSSGLYAKTGVICAPQCVTDFYGVSATCSNDSPTTTTTRAPPIDYDRLNQQCTTAAANNGETSFYIRNADDSECKTYIHCEQFDDGMEALLMKCATGYFDSTTKKCVAEKPGDCITNTNPQTP